MHARLERAENQSDASVERRAARLTLRANIAQFAFLGALGVVLNPLLLAMLGPAAFGAWKALQKLCDVVLAGDGGSAHALKWAIAQSASDPGGGRRRGLVGAALRAWATQVPLIIVLAVILAFALPELIEGLDAPLLLDTRIAGVLLAINAVLAGLLTLPASALIGTNRGYIAALATTGTLAAANGAIVLAATCGFGLIGMAGVALVVFVAGAAVQWTLAKRHIAWWGVEQPGMNARAAFTRQSHWVLVWSYGLRLVSATEMLAIGALIGALAVSDYVFTSFAAQVVIALTMMTTGSRMPTLASCLGRAARTGAAEVINQTRQTTAALATACGAAIILFNGQFVTLWAGERAYLGLDANALVAIAAVQLCLLRTDAQILDAALAVRPRALVGLSTALLSLLAAWVGYNITGWIEGLLGAVIVVRLPAMAALSRLVRDQVPDARSGTPLALLGALVLAGCWLAAHAGNDVQPVARGVLSIAVLTTALGLIGLCMTPGIGLGALRPKGDGARS